MSHTDHLDVRRPLGYTHHGIDCGDGTVIHFCGEPGSSKVHASIWRTDLGSFIDGGRLRIRHYKNRLSPEEAIGRDESRLGEPEYHLLASNCEHRDEWCRSDQVETVISVAAKVGLVGVAMLGTGAVVATAGAFSGVSAAGIMSGLATAGSVVGGGAATGPAVISAIPATAAVAVTHSLFEDDETKPYDERAARRDARMAAVGGSAAGTVGGISVLSVAGVPGLSAVGIFFGLAAIGGATGGAGAGMLAGVAALAVAPAAPTCGAAVGVCLASRMIRTLIAGDPQLDPKAFAGIPLDSVPVLCAA